MGRSAELAGLEGALEEAIDGRPCLVFVAGDSGVGKTRLLSELAARARDRGARILAGDCIELGEGELPYAPIVAMLRPLARDHDPVLGEIPPFARSELAALLPELGDGAGARRGPDPADDSAQGRLFEALLWLLGRLGQAAPAARDRGPSGRPGDASDPGVPRPQPRNERMLVVAHTDKGSTAGIQFGRCWPSSSA